MDGSTQAVAQRLQQLLGALPLHDRSELHGLLYVLFSQQHRFCLRFAEMASGHTLQQLLLAVRLYECNGLQLSGHAAWLLCTLCEHADEQAVESIANAQAMEVLLRVGLEQSIYSYCFRVLTIVTRHSADRLKLLCTTGEGLFSCSVANRRGVRGLGKFSVAKYISSVCGVKNFYLAVLLAAHFLA